MAALPHTQNYGKRSLNFTNPTAKLILETMERKKSNLAVSVDVTDKHDLLAIIEAVAPYVCMIKAICLSNYCHPYAHQSIFPKTHIDIIENFDISLTEHLQHLSHKHDFLYFEDRKFADIGWSLNDLLKIISKLICRKYRCTSIFGRGP
jgi:orotidine-5'-phosphate decarboxylase